MKGNQRPSGTGRPLDAGHGVGEGAAVDIEPPFAKLMDNLAFDTVPSARQLIELLKKRGWTKLERVAPVRGTAGTRREDTTMQHSRCER
ncbi:hypothetical protein [Streptomyces sp. NPDC052042]|uniref:hypothetical protein n=1 Tax=Streptomyces sp. NPDC052042 TaxID=3365683 RepID=UPI0037CCCD56